jgi:hypothetical protein
VFGHSSVGENKKAEVYAEVILINKALGEFRQIAFTTDKSEDIKDYEGTCSMGK